MEAFGTGMIRPMHRYVEVSHPIEAGMKTYSGLPEPSVEVLLDYDASRERYCDKAEFLIASLHLCGNTGTYVDSPRHRYRACADLAEIPLEAAAHVPVTKIEARVRPERGVGAEVFGNAQITGRAVLINTGWSLHWRNDRYFDRNPFLIAAACDLLANSGVRFVGIDSLNIDDIEDLSRPAHTILLGAGIPVCEHMTNLHNLTPEGGFLHAVPIAWVGGATFPVRAYVVHPIPLSESAEVPTPGEQ
jgi:kynurenine formamidase